MFKKKSLTIAVQAAIAKRTKYLNNQRELVQQCRIPPSIRPPYDAEYLDQIAKARMWAGMEVICKRHPLDKRS